MPDGETRLKNQYFGDVNDYLKYGILRELSKSAESLHVVWMLTESDGSADGKFTEYLSSPGKWRHYDPALFDFLRSQLLDHGCEFRKFCTPFFRKFWHQGSPRLT